MTKVNVQQLTLPVGLREDATFSNFYPGQNTILLTFLQNIAAGKGERFLYYWGQRGVGRSHLLQATCHHALSSQRSCFYLPLSSRDVLTAQVFEGLESMQVICIDDVHLIAGIPAWEEVLFHFYNRVQMMGNYLIISGQHSPQNLGLHLPDLTSRLNAGLCLQLQGLNDAEKLEVLQGRAKERGMLLSDAVGKYLLTHHARSLADLFAILEQLEQATLIAKRRLTVPFLKTVLQTENS